MIRTVRLGVALRDSAIALVALKGRRVVHALALEGEEQPAALLKAELGSRKIPWRKARVGISRSLTIVKTLRLPPAVEGSLARMVAFELERHVPFPAEEACFDFVRLPGPVNGLSEALVVAAERRTVEGVLRLMDDAGLRPISLTVAAHDLTALVGRWSRAGRAAWLHRINEEVNLLLLDGPRLRLSRSFPWTDAETLVREIRRSLALLRWETLDGLWVSGDGSGGLAASPALAAFGPVTPPPFARAAARAIDDLEEPGSGLKLLALGVALGPRRPSLNLLPESLRPRQLKPAQLATIASVAVTVLLGLGVMFARDYKDQRYMARLNQAIRALNPELRAVEQAGAELEKKRRLLATVRAVEEGSLKPLPLLRELTEIIPQEAWLTTLNLDLKGVELSGQAMAASQLIPLLENSPRLERVEFSSPVTRGRDKEQFRIRASWESPPKPAPAAVPQPGPRGATRR